MRLNNEDVEGSGRGLLEMFWHLPGGTEEVSSLTVIWTGDFLNKESTHQTMSNNNNNNNTVVLTARPLTLLCLEMWRC
jgi:hypothetical protein